MPRSTHDAEPDARRATAAPQFGKLPGAVVAPSLLVLGIVLSLVQVLTIPADVFYSGDGGVKFLLTQQFAAGGWHADLRLPSAAWVQELWQQGLYPFGPPFVYAVGERWIVGFPLAFMALTAPFYAVLGYPGLYALPMLSLWALWAIFLALARRLALSPSALSIGLAGLIFASFATPYGAIYWEHTLALALSFGGLSVLLPAALVEPAGRKESTDSQEESGSALRDRPRAAGARDFAGGVLLGASIWIRPESACFAAGTLACLAVLGVAPRRGWMVCAGLATAGLAFLALNLGVYGSPLGVHAIQAGIEQRAPGAIAVGLGRRFLPVTPMFAVATAFALLGLLHRPARSTRLEAALWLATAVFAAGACLLVPNTGGRQFGARYLMHALPLLWLIVALQWNRVAGSSAAGSRAFRIGVGLALLVGVQRNAYEGTRDLHREYEQRIPPLLVNLRATQTEVVVVAHQWMAQELAGAFGEKTFFRVNLPADLDLLAAALAARGQQHFTFVGFEQRAEWMREGQGFRLHIVPRGHLGIYYLFDGVILATAEVM